MIEMLTLVALLVSRYRFDFVDGQRESTIQKVEGAMRDQFTATPGELELVFTKREVVA